MNASSWSPALVTLHDGRQVLSDSEEWRHECEARAVIAMPNIQQRRAYLRGTHNPAGVPTGGVLAKRGEEAVKRLETTIKAIWYANRG